MKYLNIKKLKKRQKNFYNSLNEANSKKQLYDSEILKIKETNNKDNEKTNKKLIG